jgi:hypothetical protein
LINIFGLEIGALERMGVFDAKFPPTRLSFRLAFFSNSFDFENCASFFSEELEFSID